MLIFAANNFLLTLYNLPMLLIGWDYTLKTKYYG